MSGQFQWGKWTLKTKEDLGESLGYCRHCVQTKYIWPSSSTFRPGWNRKMHQCSLLSSPMLRIYFWMPLNSEKYLWNQLCCHYLLVCLDLKIKQEPTTTTKNAMSSSERALHNLCEVPISVDTPLWRCMLGKWNSMHLKDSSCSHSEHHWKVIQCIRKAENFKSHPDLEKNCHHTLN